MNDWNKLKQSIIDEISVVKKQLLTDISNDLVNRLREKGLDDSKIKISNDKTMISYEADSEQSFREGKVYFEEVMNDINNGNWLETL